MTKGAPFQKNNLTKGLSFQKDSLTNLAASIVNCDYDHVTPTQRAAAKLFTYVKKVHPDDQTLKSITNEIIASTLNRQRR